MVRLISLMLLSAAFFPGGDDPVVPLWVRGLNTSADYVSVVRALKGVPGVSRLRVWVEKDKYHLHACVTEPLRLSAVEGAIAAARLELKRTMQMDVDYALDETRLWIVSEATVAFTGLGEAAVVALERVVRVTEFEMSDTVTEARIAPEGRPVTAAAIRQAIEGAGESLLDLTVPGIDLPKPSYVCPAGCSESAAPGICPVCARDLVRTAEAPAAGG